MVPDILHVFSGCALVTAELLLHYLEYITYFEEPPFFITNTATVLTIA